MQFPPCKECDADLSLVIGAGAVSPHASTHQVHHEKSDDYEPNAGDRRYLAVQNRVGVPQPIFVFVTLAGVRGFTMFTGMRAMAVSPIGLDVLPRKYSWRTTGLTCRRCSVPCLTHSGKHAALEQSLNKPDGRENETELLIGRMAKLIVKTWLPAGLEPPQGPRNGKP